MNKDNYEHMTFTVFTEQIKQGLEQRFSAANNITISIHNTLKTNFSKTGIEIRNSAHVSAPLIYLDEYFKEFKEHADMEKTINDIYAAYLLAIDDKVPELNLDTVPDQLYFTAINTEMNSELLKQVPSEQVCDLSIVVRIMVECDQEHLSFASVLVTHDMLQTLGLTEKQLFTYARLNTTTLLPVTIESIIDVLNELEPEAFTVPEEEEFPIYVVSNEFRNNGAASLFYYPDVMEMVKQHVGGDYYILPSSIHETLVIPKHCGTDPRDLKLMVESVNHQSVSPEELLSYNIYQYDSITEEITICSEEASA